MTPWWLGVSIDITKTIFGCCCCFYIVSANPQMINPARLSFDLVKHVIVVQQDVQVYSVTGCCTNCIQFYRQLAWFVTGQAFSLNWSILSTHVAVAETSKWEFVCTAVHRLFPAPAYSGYRNGEQTPNVEGVVCVEFVTAVHIESVPGLKTYGPTSQTSMLSIS